MYTLKGIRPTLIIRFLSVAFSRNQYSSADLSHWLTVSVATTQSSHWLIVLRGIGSRVVGVAHPQIRRWQRNASRGRGADFTLAENW